jgi:hypothetical protein
MHGKGIPNACRLVQFRIISGRSCSRMSTHQRRRIIMKRNLKATLALVLLLGILLPATGQAMGPLNLNAEVAAHSKYMWRGIIITDDWVVQPSLSASVLGFGVNFWGNLDLSDANDTEFKLNEVDYTLTYGLPLPLLDLEGGLIHYRFPNTDTDATTELYLSAAANVLFSPRIAVYRDLDAFKGTYWELGASHGMPLSDVFNVELDAVLGLGSKGYLEGYFGVSNPVGEIPDELNFTGASMSNMSVTVGVPYPLIPFVKVTPSVSYHTLLGDPADARDATDADKDALVFGVTAAFNF